MKKAIELSLNFLVTIIIALVIFGFGIKFIYDIATKSENLKDMTLDQIDKKIEGLVCESTDRVCIVPTRRVIKRGNVGFFGMKIVNVISDAESNEFFFGDIRVSRMVRKDKTETEDPNILDKIDFKHRVSVEIKKNEERDIGIGVEVDREAPSGTYVVDIEIEDALNEYGGIYKIYVEVP